VVTDDPGVVAEQIEKFDHDPAFIAESDLGPLIDIANIEEEGVGIVTSPKFDLGRAPGEAAQIGMAFVIERGQDMTMEIGRVEQAQPNDIGRRLRRSQPTGSKEGAGRPAKQTEKGAAISRGNSHSGRILTADRGKTIFFAR
jgi:hypothetical protein